MRPEINKNSLFVLFWSILDITALRKGLELLFRSINSPAQIISLFNSFVRETDNSFERETDYKFLVYIKIHYYKSEQFFSQIK